MRRTDGARWEDEVDEPSPVLTAVLSALAGVRVNQVVVVLGPATVLRRALQAGTGRELAVTGPADVVIALAAPDVAGATAMLKPGGRLVALAADTGAVGRTAARHGLNVLHSEPVGGRVAWSAALPA
jgi:hypothetical protein